jgi:hypothetical protein
MTRGYWPPSLMAASPPPLRAASAGLVCLYFFLQNDPDHYCKGPLCKVWPGACSMAARVYF